MPDITIAPFHTSISLQEGLSDQEAAQRLERYGNNTIGTQSVDPLWLVFVRQFKSLIIAIMAVAAGISFAFGDYIEGLAILGVLLINALTGFFLEWRAAQSMEALQKMDVTLAKVIRNGQLKELPSEQLTIGDVLWFEAGDIIPADAQVGEARQLQTDESALTGESLPVHKSPGQPDPQTPLAEQPHRVFKGTAVVSGNGKAIVTGIGKETELGKISEMVKTATHTATPLEKKLDNLTLKLVWVTAILTILFFAIGWWQGKDWVLLLKTSIALAIAAIPEGLAIVATVSLAYGMLRLTKKNVIIKRLSAVETLGGTSVIFSDKTGTLTYNRIEVHTVCLPEDTIELRFDSQAKKTEVVAGNAKVLESDVYQKLLQLAVLCNNAHLENDPPTGDPLEISLLQWATLQQIHLADIHSQYIRTHEIPFSSDTRLMATIHKTPQGHLMAVKGAAEEIIHRCTHTIHATGEIIALTEDQKTTWQKLSEKLAAKGLRTLAFACQDILDPNASEISTQLTYVGIIGFSDPPRLEVVSSLQSCHKAGIRVIMVTGDHPATAQYIGEKIGLTTADVPPMTGSQMPTDMEHIPEKDTEQLIRTAIFARVSPAQKLGLIALYQTRGEIVGMTGDGINDAPALKKADIGIAMGLQGTQVARETAAIVLKDDSFVSIVHAIAQGRVIFGNIRKFILYLLSCNLSEIFVVTVAGLMGFGTPLTPIQILFLNVVTDVFPALALGISIGDDSVMQQKPRPPGSPILSKPDWWAVVIYAVLIMVSVVGGAFYSQSYLHVSTTTDNNIIFYSLCLAQLFHVFNMTSGKAPFFRNEVTTNRYVWLALLLCGGILLVTYEVPFLRQVLSIQSLSLTDGLVILVAALVPMVVIQILKRLRVVW